MNHKRGFTLIELLVVISIMVILITMGVTSFTTAQRKGRDAKRKADLREIKTALEQYYTVCGYLYPTPVLPDGYYDPVVCTSPVTVGILENMPEDPRTGTAYACPVTGDCTENGFNICTELESESPTTYCVTNSQ